MAAGIPCHKVILVGEYGVGKSSLFRRFVDNSFEPDPVRLSKAGLDNFSKTMKIEEQAIQLRVWDTAGIERFTVMSPSYYKDASAVIVCFALNDRESFGCTSQYVLEAVDQTKTAKIFLCGTKKDIVSENPVTSEDIENFAQQLDTVVCETFQVSSQTGEGVHEMFESVGKILARIINEKCDPSRIRVSLATKNGQDEQKRCC